MPQTQWQLPAYVPTGNVTTAHCPARAQALRIARLRDMRKSHNKTGLDPKALEEQRATRRAANNDPQLQEQVKTEVEQRPYLDTEGGE